MVTGNHARHTAIIHTRYSFPLPIHAACINRATITPDELSPIPLFLKSEGGEGCILALRITQAYKKPLAKIFKNKKRFTKEGSR